MDRQAETRVGDRRRRGTGWRTVAAGVALVAGVGAAACTAGSSEVTLIGERIGVLVWQPVSRATSYEVELTGANDQVIETLRTVDTIAPLPPTFVPDSTSRWLVRALRDDRVIASSARTRLY
ncbi:MAG: hypothetical protein ACFLMY_13705 [Candidatus Brachytrichaceae bacterium NZ_4S206]|jgi:hypothetical protein